jgi:hypothetical protein
MVLVAINTACRIRQKDWCSDNAVNFYTGGARFESCLKHWCGFLLLLQVVDWMVPRAGVYRLLKNNFQFIIHQSS